MGVLRWRKQLRREVGVGRVDGGLAAETSVGQRYIHRLAQVRGAAETRVVLV